MNFETRKTWITRALVGVALVSATIAAGVALGQRLDPSRRRAAFAATVPFACPVFSFFGVDGGVVSRQSLVGHRWVATFDLQTCDDTSERRARRLAALRAAVGPETPIVELWLGPGDDWRAVRARRAPIDGSLILAADVEGDGLWLRALNDAAGRPSPPDAREPWTRAVLVVDRRGTVRAVRDIDDEPRDVAAELTKMWPSLPLEERTAPRPHAATPTLVDFRAHDQDGQLTTNETLRGRVLVVDFIFTSCTGVCPTLSARMVSLQRRLRGDAYRFVSFSVDPEHDTPEVLRAYAARWTTSADRWRLLALDRDGVERVARGLRAAEAAPSLHDDRFMLVGVDGMVRGRYAVTEPGELDLLARDARALAGGPEDAPIDGDESLLALGCLGCHGDARTAPALFPLAGRSVRLASGVTVTADDAYLRRAIVAPAADLVAGYGPTMPSYAGQLGARELDAIVAALER
ncbi:MAG TPA: SCO family protein [Polyangia bacterium]|nr:SCO family protein [Polyangia bacterium]